MNGIPQSPGILRIGSLVGSSDSTSDTDGVGVTADTDCCFSDTEARIGGTNNEDLFDDRRSLLLLEYDLVFVGNSSWRKREDRAVDDDDDAIFLGG